MQKEKVMKIGLVIILLIMSVVLMSETVAEPPSNFSELGAGLSIENPYLISSLANLRWLSETVSAWGTANHLGVVTQRFFYKQTADIDATETKYWNQGKGFSPIGDASEVRPGVWGSFFSHYDGSDFTITNLYINRPNTRYVGLFGNVVRGSVSRMILENVTIRGNRNVGGIVGAIYVNTNSDLIEFAHLKNNKVSGTVEGNIEIGGLAGFVGTQQTVVLHNIADVTVIGDYSIGGLIGIVWQATIRENVAYGNVSGTWGVGGLIGATRIGTSINNPISNNFATGAVSGIENVGGLIGINDGSIVEKSYALGRVTGELRVGGLIGWNSTFHISVNISSYLLDSVFDTETSGLNEVVGFQCHDSYSINSYGKTTAEMKMKSTFTALGWDFEKIWDIDPDKNNGYPFLRREPVVSDTDITLPLNQSMLFANYPNPFNPNTNINFVVTRHALPVHINIYNVRGQKVRTLLDGSREFGAGEHSVVWDGRDDNGRLVSSGVYLYRMTAGEYTATRRMVLMK